MQADGRSHGAALTFMAACMCVLVSNALRKRAIVPTLDRRMQVNQEAQQTDAGQLSRNLLLVPRATVNVKPNLQIIADDVTCTHGCAVSDLSAEEMFYFRSRGIDEQTARRALVVSFGAEVLQALGHEELISRMQDIAREMLTDVV